MTTTKNSLPVSDDLRKLLTEGSGDFLREAMIAIPKEFMEAQIAQLVGAAQHERNDEPQDHRNGHRERRFDTRVGTIDLQVPRLRKGNSMPSFLEPRSRAEQALLNVIQEAYVHGVSTRKVADLLRAMGLEGVSKSEVSRICQALDEQVDVFRNRPLTQRYPYLWLDATYLKVRDGGRVVSNAVVVAYAVNDEGYREVIGVSVGASETESFWTEFLRSLVARGLSGVHGPFPAQRRSQGGQGGTGDGGGLGATDLFAAGSRERPGPVAPDGRDARRQMPPGIQDALGQRGGPARPPALPRAAPQADPLHELLRALEQGDQAPLGRGGHLSEPCRRTQTDWNGARRAKR